MNDERPVPPTQDGDGGVDQKRRQLLTWLWRAPVIAGAGAALFAAYRAYSTLFERGRASLEPQFEPHEAQEIASLADFSSVWHAVEFQYAGLPVVALRLPEAVAGGLSSGEEHFIAFSRVCTHQACIVNLNRDSEAIAFAFNYRSSGPALVCDCHLSVFAPLRAGEAVSGPALRPLPRVQLAAEQNVLRATGVERT